MKTESKNELLSAISEILDLAPSLRLGQLIGILTDQTDHPYSLNSIVDIDDDELLPAANEFLEVLRRRQTEIEREHNPLVMARAG